MARAVHKDQTGSLDRSNKKHQKVSATHSSGSQKRDPMQYGATAGGWAQTAIIRLPSTR